MIIIIYIFLTSKLKLIKDSTNVLIFLKDSMFKSEVCAFPKIFFFLQRTKVGKREIVD